MASRAMFDVWSPGNSVLREKVLEHIFLSELAKALLLRMRIPFEVLRSEFDGHGYDVVIEACGVVRHTQLKATRIGGKRASVDVNLSLTRKPGGCVVWFMVDEATLEIGPFYWLGGRAGEALPTPVAKFARHSRANAAGIKGERRGVIEIGRRHFTEMGTMTEVAQAMFGKDDHRSILRAHLRERGVVAEELDLDPGLSWRESGRVAYLIDGYALASEAGLGDAVQYADERRRQAECGGWEGTALELWVAFFMEHRRDHFSGFIGTDLEMEPEPLLDDLAQSLAAALIADRVSQPR